MDAFMNLQILRTGKYFAAAGKGTGKGFFSGMYPNVVDQLVFGLKRSTFSGTIFPKTGMVGHFGATHMFHGNMSHNFMQGSENFTAWFSGTREVLVDP